MFTVAAPVLSLPLSHAMYHTDVIYGDLKKRKEEIICELLTWKGGNHVIRI